MSHTRAAEHGELVLDPGRHPVASLAAMSALSFPKGLPHVPESTEARQPFLFGFNGSIAQGSV